MDLVHSDRRTKDPINWFDWMRDAVAEFVVFVAVVEHG